jgi:hypothetical protein
MLQVGIVRLDQCFPGPAVLIGLPEQVTGETVCPSVMIGFSLNKNVSSGRKSNGMIFWFTAEPSVATWLICMGPLLESATARHDTRVVVGLYSVD